MTIDYTTPLGHGVGKQKPSGMGRRTSRKKSLSIDQQIANLQALGFTVTVPTSGEERERQEASLEKLGFAEAKTPVKSKRTPAVPEYLIGQLYLAHSVAEATYGPGELKLPMAQSALFRSLMQQDQAVVRSLMDTSDRQPFSRCYLITPGRGQDQKNKFTKLEVSQETFDSDHFINNVTVRAGATDIAGYNPSSVPRTF